MALEVLKEQYERQTPRLPPGVLVGGGGGERPRYTIFGPVRLVVRNPSSEKLTGVCGRARWYWTWQRLEKYEAEGSKEALRAKVQILQRDGAVRTDYGMLVAWAEAYAEPADLYPGQTGTMVLVPQNGVMARRARASADYVRYEFYAVGD